MQEIQILSPREETTLLSPRLEDDSIFSASIMQSKELKLHFFLPNYQELPLLSRVVYNGENFYLYRLPEVIKHSRHKYEYTAVFSDQTEELKAIKYKFIKETGDEIDFPLTAKITPFIELLINNLNAFSPASNWSFLINDDQVKEKTIAFSNEDCLTALNKICGEFNSEWEIQNKTIIIGKVAYYENKPFALSYGKDNGLLKGLRLSTKNDKIPISRLFVVGDERNIDARLYNSKRLLLPKNYTYQYKGKEYKTDKFGTSIRLSEVSALPFGREESFDGKGIFPQRVGRVSKVERIEKQDDNSKTYYDIDIYDDSIETNLDYSRYQIAGEKAFITFQSGKLAGRSFDIATNKEGDMMYFHNERKFLLVRNDEKSEGLEPEIGDEYIVFGVALPNEYIEDRATESGASFELLRSAIKVFASSLEDGKTYEAMVDAIFAYRHYQNFAPYIRIGAFFRLLDSDFDKEEIIRLQSYSFPLNDIYQISLSLSNEANGETLSNALAKIEAEKVITAKQSREAFAFAKRSFSDAVETSEKLINAKLQGFTDKIKPIAIETMQLIAGSEQSQFVFLDPDTRKQRSISIRFDKNRSELLISPRLLLQHKTYKQKEISPNKNFYSWLVNETTLGIKRESPALYLYAIASKENQDTPCSLLLSEEALDFDSAENLNCLIGILSSPNEEGDRSFAPLYGYSEILGGRITTDRIVSADGSTSFDLQEGLISGNIKFLDPNGETILGREKGETSISGGLVLSNVIALKDDANEVRAYLDGNTKHKTAFSAGVQNAFTPNEKANIVIAHDGSARFGLMNISPTAKIFLGESEDKAFMELGQSSTKIQDKLAGKSKDIAPQERSGADSVDFPESERFHYSGLKNSIIHLQSINVEKDNSIYSFKQINLNAQFNLSGTSFFSNYNIKPQSQTPFTRVSLCLKNNDGVEIELSSREVSILREWRNAGGSSYELQRLNQNQSTTLSDRSISLSKGVYSLYAKVACTNDAHSEYEYSNGSITTSISLSFSGSWDSNKKEISITDRGLLYFLDRHNYFLINTEKGNGLPFIKARGDIDLGLKSDISLSLTLSFRANQVFCAKKFGGGASEIVVNKFGQHGFLIETDEADWDSQQYLQVNWEGWSAVITAIRSDNATNKKVIEGRLYHQRDGYKHPIPEGLEMNLMLIRNRN